MPSGHLVATFAGHLRLGGRERHRISKPFLAGKGRDWGRISLARRLKVEASSTRRNEMAMGEDAPSPPQIDLPPTTRYSPSNHIGFGNGNGADRLPEELPMNDGCKYGEHIGRTTAFLATVIFLGLCLANTLKAEEWYLPNGQTITTQAGSTPPVSEARREPYPNPTLPQIQANDAPLPVITIVPAPSIAQLTGLLPQNVEGPIMTSREFSDAQVGQWGGECAAFAQKAREDLLHYAPYGSANKMPDKARDNDFVVNGTPRVGSILIIAKPTGSKDGHAEVVTGVRKDGDRYILTIKDSNANFDELISSRTIYYTPSENGAFGNFGTYEEASPGLTKLAPNLIVMGFIQEKKVDDAK